MKTVFLLRHAEPEQLQDIPGDLWPLSERGRQQAQAFLARAELGDVSQVYASPLTRALETAQHAGVLVQVDERLRERIPGEASSEMGDCWLRQYMEPGFKCPGGESFDEVGMRMSASVEDILTAMMEGEQSLVVTHAAAICAYLMRFGTVQVIDRTQKLRKISLVGKSVYTGNIPPLCCFRLEFLRAICWISLQFHKNRTAAWELLCRGRFTPPRHEPREIQVIQAVMA